MMGEKQVPKEPDPRTAFSPYKLGDDEMKAWLSSALGQCKGGYFNIMDELGLKWGMAAVKGLEQKGYRALVVTHRNPVGLDKEFGGCEGRRYIYVTGAETPEGVKAVHPGELEYIYKEAGDLIRECQKDGKTAVIYFELAQIITHNSFESLAKLAGRLYEKAQVCAENAPVMIMSVNTKMLEVKELETLRSSFTYDGSFLPSPP